MPARQPRQLSEPAPEFGTLRLAYCQQRLLKHIDSKQIQELRMLLARDDVGEASVAIVAASPHRGDAFAACRYVIERVKQIVPVWKHEHFDGGDVWIEGATADPEDQAAREQAERIACA